VSTPVIAASSLDAVASLATHPDAPSRADSSLALQLPPASDGSSAAEPSYRTLDATYRDLARLAAQNPDLATWTDIGDSYDKLTPGGAAGFDLYALRLTRRLPNRFVLQPSLPEQVAPQVPAKPVLLVQAGSQGGAYATTEIVARFAELLVAGYGVDADATWLLDYRDIRLLPIVNPDGRRQSEQGTPWSKNTNPTPPIGSTAAPFPSYGVNLNRNFDVQWGTVGASSDPASPVYAGSAPFSEPETQALRDYLRDSFVRDSFAPQPSTDDVPLAQDRAGVFLHLLSEGNALLYPWHWTETTAPDAAGLHTLGLKLGGFMKRADGTAYTVQPASRTGLVSGTPADWVYKNFRVASYTARLGSQPLEPSTTFEQTTAPQMLSALMYAAKAAHRPYQQAAGPESLNLSLSENQAIAGITNSVVLTITADATRYAANNRPGSEAEKQPRPIAGARYTVNAPSWTPDIPIYSLTVADGKYDSTTEVLVGAVDTSNLAPGRHTLFVESVDAAGNYGVPSAIFLDVLSAPADARVIRGSDAADVLSSVEDFNSLILGRGGNDRIQTGNGMDLILAGAGNDQATAGGDDDRLYGGTGDDQLVGGSGNDALYGEAGRDQLVGGDGDDLLWGGAGADRLTGGAGADTYALVYNEGADTITDFELGRDRIGLVGTLDFNQLQLVQTSTSTRIQFGQVLLAELVGVTTPLTAADFVRLSPTA